MQYISSVPETHHIKHVDSWGNKLYLTSKLIFTNDKNQAANFYLLNTNGSLLINEDIVSINCGNKLLAFKSDGEIIFVENTQREDPSTKFLITSGSKDNMPISCDSCVFFISDVKEKMALKYTRKYKKETKQNDILGWQSEGEEIIVNASYKDAPNYDRYSFVLERSDSDGDNYAIAYNNVKKNDNLSGSNKSAIMIILLFILLFLCIFISK